MHLFAFFIILISIPLMADSRRIRIQEIYHLNPEATQQISSTIQVPLQQDPGQQIETMVISPAHKQLFQQNGHFYTTHHFVQPEEPITIRIQTDLILTNRDLNTVLRQPVNPGQTLADARPYLIDEPFIPTKHPDIQTLAGSLRSNQPQDTLYAIYRYTIDHMNYTGFTPEDRGGLYGYQTGQGDCTEYSDLFVTLARACAIPARVVQGYTLDYTETPRHTWVEAFLTGYGWIRFDPTFGDQTDPTLQEYFFAHLKNYYIAVSTRRNDPVLNNMHSYYIENVGGKLQVGMDTRFQIEIAAQ